MADTILKVLENLLAAEAHIHVAGPEYVKARDAALAAIAALAAEPPAPAEPDTDAVLTLAAIIREVDGNNSLGADALAEAVDGEQDHVPGAGNMVPADGEAEELAQWLERIGDDYDDLYRLPSALIRPKLARAAALLREARPQPPQGGEVEQ